MAVVAARDARSSPIRNGLPASFKREGVVYSIAFEMDIEQLRVHYGDPYNNAYCSVRLKNSGRAFLAIRESSSLPPNGTRNPWLDAALR
jgi:hypothetical protein